MCRVLCFGLGILRCSAVWICLHEELTRLYAPRNYRTVKLSACDGVKLADAVDGSEGSGWLPCKWVRPPVGLIRVLPAASPCMTDVQWRFLSRGPRH